MSLKLFIRKKKVILEKEQLQLKEQLDTKKVDALDQMVLLLKEIKETIHNTNTTITKPDSLSNRNTQNNNTNNTSTFIPSIDTSNVSSKTISSVKKETKKRKISSIVDKLNLTDKQS